VRVEAVPAPLEISGPWEVSFAVGQGAPARVQLPELVSWHTHADVGVKYFSGAATYRKTFEAPAEFVSDRRRVFLDLGKVAVSAEVKLNGKPLGVLWKAPFRVEVTGLLAAGQNTLEAAVVNLWINRMIGDERLPEDSNRNPNGTLKSWPDWLLEGKPNPAERVTFTSWRLWKKGSPLQESGLLGPVRLQAATVVAPE
jgi:hypothetical protein